jgi:biopolymer transport protein ExbD
MLTRPLDLASRLRPPPRNFDHVFLINIGLIALFFVVFDSPYVLAPALEVGGFEVPTVAGAEVGAPTPTLSITVTPGGSSTSGPSIYVDSGHHNLAQFKERLRVHAGTVKSPVLWMRVDRRVPFGDWSDIRDAADDAGFRVYTAGQNPPAAAPVSR